MNPTRTGGTYKFGRTEDRLASRERLMNRGIVAKRFFHGARVESM